MADAWGIDPGYHDVDGNWHDTSPDVRRQLRVAMGGHHDVDDPPPSSRPVWFVRHGSGPPIERPAELALEDGTTLHADHELPSDVPLGYHDLHPSDGGPVTRLIVVPDRCSAAPERAFGWTVQLYAARSRSSWGIGDLGDLATFGRWAAAGGAGFVATSPLHAPLPVDHLEPSPYFASSRRWRNPLHLRIEAIPGWDAADAELAALAVRGRAFNADPLIDRDLIWAAKRDALMRIWTSLSSSSDGKAFADFTTWRRTQGRDLQRYATFCALAEHYGDGWPAWAPEHRRPESMAVDRFVAANADRVAFHAWVQWLLDVQLAEAASSGVALVHDLAIGADPSGADAWVWQDALASGVRVGAPPDAFNQAGQDWTLPPFVPWKLRAAGYEPLAGLLQAAFRHAVGLRIDHVMGLFRLWWIPEGAGPSEGGYVRYPASELLDIVALESQRAGAFVVGEDLGTVEDEVRAELAERAVLSYKLVWFENGSPDAYPSQALAAVTTHDLPTVAGVWSGADGDDVLRDRLVVASGVEPDVSLDDAVTAVHRRLAASPSQLVAATLDDAVGAEVRPNVPGTTTERPNWSIPLPVAIDDLDEHPLAVAVSTALREGRSAC